MEKHKEVPQKIKNKTILGSSNPTSGYFFLKKIKKLTEKDICVHTFTAALLTRAKTEKQAMCPLMDEWINRCIQWNTIQP